MIGTRTHWRCTDHEWIPPESSHCSRSGHLAGESGRVRAWSEMLQSMHIGIIHWKNTVSSIGRTRSLTIDCDRIDRSHTPIRDMCDGCGQMAEKSYQGHVAVLRSTLASGRWLGTGSKHASTCIHADEYAHQPHTSAYIRHKSNRVKHFWLINWKSACFTRKCQDAGLNTLFEDPNNTRQPHKVTSDIHATSGSHPHPNTHIPAGTAPSTGGRSATTDAGPTDGLAICIHCNQYHTI
jgi:hypothetical protein